MGQRANLILVRNGSYQLYYNHWCANRLDEELFWGPEESLAFIESQNLTEEWLDDRWAEGGVLMDIDHQVLLWYGGENILYDIPLRRQLFTLMQTLWCDWELRWASAGIVDMAKYLNVPLEQVRSVEHTGELITTIEPEPKGGFIRTIASIVFENDDLRVFPLYQTFSDCLLDGPSFIQAINPSSGQQKLCMGEWSEDFPDQGFHLNLRHKTLDIWYADTDSDIIQHVTRYWSDWTVNDLGDRYEEQSKLTGEAIIFAPQSQTTLIERLRSMLLRSSSRSGANSVKLMVDHFEQEGKSVKVNPLAFIDHQQELDLTTREAKFEYAVTRILR
ncbi:hypothetical protein D3C73_578160 [compost metagenome]